MPEISAIVHQFPYFGLFLLLILGGLGLPFPEDTTLMLCGFLISEKVVGPVPALLVVYGGLIFTDTGLYFVGKKYGRMIVTHKRFQKVISPERLASLEEKFRKYGVLVILIGRHIVGLRAQLFLSAGVMKMSLPRFLAADGFSAVITMAIMVGAGYLGGNSLESVKKDISRIEDLAILAAVVVVALFFIFRYFRSRRKPPL